MKETCRSGILVQSKDGKWEITAFRPTPGKGEYIEVMPDGQRRRYFNRSEDDNTYQLI